MIFMARDKPPDKKNKIKKPNNEREVNTMKRTLQRLLSVTVSAAMLVSLTGIVWADNLTDGVDEGSNKAAVGTSITINKEIEVFNSGSATVYAPPITYTYTVTAASVTNGVQTVKDEDGVVGKVYAGDLDALTNTNDQATVTFVNTNSVTATTSGGVYFTNGFTLNFDPDEYEHSGVYRYVITQTTGGFTGVTLSGDNVRYLDVYVRLATTSDSASTDYVIYGYVLSKADSAAFNVDDSDISNRDATIKTNGFVHTGATNAGTDSSLTVDRYNTYNATITKNVTGAFGDKGHEFPFAFTLTSAANGARVSASTTGSNLTGFTSGTAEIASGTLAGTVELSDTKSVTISGIPNTSTLSVTETNDTYDIYKVSTTSTNSVATDLTATAKDQNETATLSGIAPSALTSDVAVTFTNLLDTVSPTGLMLRIAPFAVLLAAGSVFIFIAQKAREDENESA